MKTYDPYDFRFSRIGNKLYRLYFRSKVFIVFIAFAEAFKPVLRFFGMLKPHNYPLVEIFRLRRKNFLSGLIEADLYGLIELGRRHDDILGFGLNRNLPIDAEVFYRSDEVFTTVTVYAYRLFAEIENPSKYTLVNQSLIESFFVDGIEFTEVDDLMYCSYSRNGDRFVLNAMTYVLGVYDDMKFRKTTIYQNNKQLIDDRISSLLKTILFHQNSNGSWPYAIGKASFVDCLHSAFMLEVFLNLKSLKRSSITVAKDKCFSYLREHHFDSNTGLYYRYPLNYSGLRGFLNKSQISLYDNVEMFNVLSLDGQFLEARNIRKAIDSIFKDDNTLFNRICCKFKYGKNYWRWGLIQKYYYYSIHEEN